jgi:Glycerophosphoryl diester phosphodiesterase
MKLYAKMTASALALLSMLTVGSWLHPLLPDGAPPYRAKPVNAAHRGGMGAAPENTMAAFDMSASIPADYIELDVRTSRDGRLVVIHDDTVDRTTDGTGSVKEMTVSELRKLDAGSAFHRRFRGERIPLLEEVLNRYAGKIGLLIEMKEHDPEAASRLAEVLGRYAFALPQQRAVRPELAGDRRAGMIVQSFHLEFLNKFHRLRPDVPLALLVERGRRLRDADLFEYTAYIRYVNLHWKDADIRTIQRLHAFGLLTLPYTVRRYAQMTRLLKAGADGWITDYPARFRSL